MFDWEAFERAGIEGAVAALERGGDLIVTRAKDKAPVRKVFAGQEGKVRYAVKSVAEIKRDRPIREELGLSPERTHLFPPMKVVRDAPRKLEARGLPTDVTGLSRRGRYEARVGRANDANQLGGRLRREIHRTAVGRDGRVYRLRVVSPTPYAKYQEFGTEHNAAHPYLRPAAHESLPEIKRDVAISTIRAAKSAARGRLTKVVVPMKVAVR